MNQERKLKVLISAYACEPHKGSEPGVGWNWAKQIARFSEAWVITRANNREVIEEELRSNPEPNLHFVYMDLPKWIRFWKRGQRGFHLYYLLWQYAAYWLARKMFRQFNFDLAHHLTFGNIWLPTFMHLLSIPFIWGPVGGGEQIPKVFRRDFDLRARLKENIRDTILHTLKVNLFFFNTCRKAKLIIAKTGDTARMISHHNQNKSRIIVATDVAVNPYSFDQRHKNHSEIKIIAIGGLEPWRGYSLLLRAFSLVAKEHIGSKLVILGEGWDRRRLTRMCIENDLVDKVLLTGHVTKERYMQYLEDSTIFVNPCLKEGGVTVLFDALSIGLPVVCFDLPGSSEVVTDECGIKVKPINPEQTIKELSDALLKLANDPELRKKMGKAGRKRVQEFYTWEKKGEFIRQVYEEVLGYKI